MAEMDEEQDINLDINGQNTTKRPKSPDMFLYKRSKGDRIDGKEHRMLLNVYGTLRTDYPLWSKNKCVSSTAKYCGISSANVWRAITKRKKGIVVSSGPVKKKPRDWKAHPHYNQKCDESVLNAIRGKVHDMYRAKIPPTCLKIMKRLAADGSLPTVSRGTIYACLKKLNFRMASKRKNSLLVECDDVIAWRHRYLRQMRDFRESKRPIVFLDETWVNVGHTSKKALKAKSATDLAATSAGDACPDELALETYIDKGTQFIIIHAGGEDGFVPGAEAIFEGKTGKDRTDNGINAESFQNWCLSKLFPGLKKHSVIVMDDEAYHSAEHKPLPAKSPAKCVIQDWLTLHNIPWSHDMVKAELNLLVEKHKESKPVYVIDKLAEARGHTVLRLPPQHSELNPIEAVFSDVKQYIAWNNASSKEGGVIPLIQEAISKVTLEKWHNCCEHVCQVEMQMWEADKMMDCADQWSASYVDNSDDDEGGEDDLAAFAGLNGGGSAEYINFENSD